MVLRHAEYKTVEAMRRIDFQNLQIGFRRNGSGGNNAVADRIMQHGTVLQNQRELKGQPAQNRHHGKAGARRCDSQRKAGFQQLFENGSAFIGDRDIGLKQRTVKVCYV